MNFFIQQKILSARQARTSSERTIVPRKDFQTNRVLTKMTNDVFRSAIRTNHSVVTQITKSRQISCCFEFASNRPHNTDNPSTCMKSQYAKFSPSVVRIVRGADLLSNSIAELLVFHSKTFLHLESTVNGY